MPETTLLNPAHTAEREILQEEAFKRMIALERKRTERSAKPFLLMLLETGEQNGEQKSAHILTKVISVLSNATRETDVIGSHKNTSVGVLFTHLVIFDQKSILSAMLASGGAASRSLEPGAIQPNQHFISLLSR